MTASEARRNWFRLLDEIGDGEVVVIERGGRRIVLRREPSKKGDSKGARADYRKLLRVPRIGDAHRWSWRWGRSEPASSVDA